MISKNALEKRKARKSNPEIIALTNFLKKQESPLWRTIAKLVTMPSRKAVAVNIEKINKMSKGDAVVIVPGKILSKGDLTHETTIIALRISEAAKAKLAKKANIMTISEFIKKKDDFKGIPIKIIT